MKTFLLTIGDELLIGQITDTNAAWMAQQLHLNGHIVTGKMTAGDRPEAIQDALRIALERADLVLITGGLGATKDDITKKALADYFGAAMVFHQETYDRIERFFARLGRTVSELNRLSCYMPDNAKILVNEKGLSPGMLFEKDGKVIVSMPGVPDEMKYLMEAEALPFLKKHYDKTLLAHRTILTVGEGETAIAALLTDFENNLPEHIRLAYLPDKGQVRLRLTGTGKKKSVLNRELDKKKAELEALIPGIVFGYENDNLSAAVGRMLKERDLMLGTAESCSGGYLAHLITSEEGSSGHYRGGIVSYDNAVKIKELKVRPDTLRLHGAVSEETIREMVAGALDALEADVVIATTGIAGPGGGTPEKPVGTIWIAVGDRKTVKTQCLHLFRDRLGNIQYTAVATLNMLRKFLSGQ